MKSNVALGAVLLLVLAVGIVVHWHLQAIRQQLASTEARVSVIQVQFTNLETQLRRLDRPEPAAAPARRPFPRRTQIAVPQEVLELESLQTNGNRSWSPEQATGEPDTFEAGDRSTAWASREQDGGEEWLKLEFEKAVEIAEVRVRETYNPGAVIKVTAFPGNGMEVTLWEGLEPVAEAPVDASFSVDASVVARSIKVYLDSARVKGWNEIDAVELIGRDGSRQWARAATASSTFGMLR